MSRFSSFFAGFFTGVVTLYLCMHFVVVRASDGFHFIPKLAPKLESPYVDIRTFKLEDWQKNQSLALAIMKSNKGNLMQDSASGWLEGCCSAGPAAVGDQWRFGAIAMGIIRG